MRANRIVPLMLCLALTTGAALRAEGPGDAREGIRRGIQALGGEARLARCDAMSYQARGKVHFRGVALPFTARFLCRHPSQYCLSFSSELFKATAVLDGDKGWQKLNDEVTEMTADRVAEVRDELHVTRILGMVALLKDKGFQLSLLGKTIIDGGEAVGVLVRHKGQRDAKLYLSTKTWLPVKLESRISEEGKEMTQETFYSDYKPYDGVQRPGKVVILRDGKPYSEASVCEHWTLEKKACDKEIARSRP
jgi:hypothetical protein